MTVSHADTGTRNADGGGSPNAVNPLADIDERTPVRLLSAGPGCDTHRLLRRILGAPGRRLACVLSNAAALDGIEIDADRSDDRLLVLRSGNVCFLMDGIDVIEALNRLHLRKMGLTGATVAYDEVLIDLPDAVQPLAIVFQLQTDSRLVLTYRFETLVGAVDAAIRHRSADPEPPFLATVGRADGVIVTNADKADPGDAAALLAAIAAINPFVPVATVAADGVLSGDLERILFPPTAAWAERIGIEGAVAMTPDAGGPAARRVECFANNPINDARSNEPSPLGPVRAVHVRLSGHADIFKISSVVARLAERAGEHLYRLRCTTSVPHATNPVEFRFVDGRFIPPVWSVSAGAPETVLTVVGRNFEVRDVMADVTACWWDADAIARGEYNPF